MTIHHDLYAAYESTAAKKNLVRGQLLWEVIYVFRDFFPGNPVSSESLSIPEIPIYLEAQQNQQGEQQNQQGNLMLEAVVSRIADILTVFAEVHYYEIPSGTYNILKSLGCEFYEHETPAKKRVNSSRERVEEKISQYLLQKFEETNPSL